MDDKRAARIEDMLAEIRETLVRHEVLLDAHIRRTGLAEENIALLRTEVDPLKANAVAWGIAGKVIATLSSLVAIAAGVYKILG